jgi:hypothetical protein
VNILERHTTEGSSGPKHRTVADAGLFPKPSLPVRKCRKSASTVVTVITGSPYKQQLEMKQNKSKQPKLKTEVFESHDGTGTSKKPRPAEVKRQEDWFCKICEISVYARRDTVHEMQALGA